MNIDSVNLIHLLEHADIGVVIHAWDTQIVYANPAAVELLDTSLTMVKSKTGKDEHWEFIDRQNRRLHIDEYPVNKVVRLGTPLTDEIIGIVQHSTGSVKWVSVSAYPEKYKDNSQGFIVVYFTEITEQITNFSYQDIVQNAQDMIIVTEAQNIDGPLSPKIIYVNDAICRLSEYSREELIGETPRIFQGALTDKSVTLRIRHALIDQRPVKETLLNYTKSGKPYWVEMSIFPLTNRFGEVTHFASVERDVSSTKFYSEQLNSRNDELKLIRENLEKLVGEKTRELRNANVKLEKLAYFDELTDIPNRRAFYDMLEKASHFSQRNHYSLIVGIADVDHFKHLNDTYGHGLGDEVLYAIAQIMKQFFRQEDGIGRLGGEEFGFFMVVPPSLEPEKLLNRLRRKVENINQSVPQLKNQKVTISIGAYHVAKVENLEGKWLMNEADKALYCAKNEGRNRVHIHRHESNNTTAPQ